MTASWFAAIVLLLVAGAAVTTIVQAWRTPGLRRTQRWSRSLWAGLPAVTLGGVIIAAALRSEWASTVYTWAVFVAIVVTFTGSVLAWTVDRIAELGAHQRDLELGVPIQPRPAKFWTLALSLAAVFSAIGVCTFFLAWFYAHVGEQLTAWANAGADPSVNPYATSTPPPEALVALGACAGVGLLLGVAVAGGRLAVRRRVLSAHATLLAGIASRERAQYEAGYEAGRYDSKQD